MSTYTQILYHIAWTTKHMRPSLQKEDRLSLFEHISKLLKKRKCHLHGINGTEDHIHILLNIHPSIAPADLVKTIKLSCTQHIKEKLLFQDFNGWQEGYVAFTHSIDAKEKLNSYIKNQQQLHQSKSYTDELTMLLEQHQIEFDDKYLL